MTVADLKEVAAIINQVIETTPHLNGKISVTHDDFSSANGTGNLICWGEEEEDINGYKQIKINAKDKFKIYFEDVAQNRKLDYGQLYHLLKFDYALSTLRNKGIQLSALSYLWDNDPSEQTEFFRRHGFLKNIIDDNVEEIKNKVFIFCFSDSFRDEKAWSLYGHNETGIALGFRFEQYSTIPAHTNLYQLNDLVYDGGYDFDFINDIQFKLKKKFGKQLLWGGLPNLPKFYKRAKYSWEREIRLCFDYHANEESEKVFKKRAQPFPEEINLEKHFPKQFDEALDRHFIKVPFENNLFKLKVTEIICGKKITNPQIEQLQKQVDANTIVWRRQ